MNTSNKSRAARKSPHRATAESSMFEIVGVIQEDLMQCSALLRAAALAVRSAPFREIRGPAKALIESAVAALRHALDAEGVNSFVGRPHYDEYGDLHLELFRLAGAAMVLSAALDAPEPISGRGVAELPLGDALELLAEAAGEDLDQGLSHRAEVLLGKIRCSEVEGPRHLRALPGGQS